MEKRIFSILGILLMLVVSSKSNVIRRDIHSGDGEISLEGGKFNKDKTSEPQSESWNPEAGEKKPAVYEVDRGVSDPDDESPDYDDTKPGKDETDDEADKTKPGIIKPETIPPNEEPDDKVEDNDEDETADGEDEKKTEEGFYEPFDGDSDKSVDDDEGSKLPSDEIEDESQSSEDDDDKRTAGEAGGDGDEDDKKMSEEEEEEEDLEISDEAEDDKDPYPSESAEVSDEDDKNDNKFGGDWKSGFFSGGSIFHRPFFSLNQVRKYFNQMERALGHVFTQTVNEALLLNGTYANTTEEEVDIDGKKYIVQKSVIKGADNHSSIYVETLSSKPKENDTKKTKEADVNVTGV